MKKRILFQKNMQRKFLEDSINALNLNWNELSEKLKIIHSTLSKTYRFEKSRLPYPIVKKICRLTNQHPNEILLEYNGKITNDGIIKPRKVIGEKRKKLEEINILFTQKAYDISLNNISFSKADKKKGIILPTKISPLLAEEIGMHLGDGYLSVSKYEYRLKGNKQDEKEYYDHFIKKLFKELYNLNVNLKEYDSTYGFEINSKAIHQFKSKVLKIKTGKKDNIGIPEILKINDKIILSSLLRGIFDTDGNIYFLSRYGYKNYYPRISIGQKSEKLIKDINFILKMFGFNPSIHVGTDFSSICLYGYSSLKKYMEEIGFKNPKHIKKVNLWIKSYPNLWR
ncbi:MAG: hypothetical protein KKF44_06320 [Nanoarchaeota archaeon]|nr:hypothetical protein [Nanoarchaeota archaeon]